jgi:hypothetical protein
MKKLFTQTFFRLSSIDQGAIVDAVLRDIDGQCWASEQDRKKAERRRKAIIKKSVEYGILGGESDDR